MKKSRMLLTATNQNPELEKELKAKAKDDQVRIQMRKHGKRGGIGMDKEYLEDNPYDGVSLSALRRQAIEEQDFGDDSDEEEMELNEDDDWMASRKSYSTRSNAATDNADAEGDGGNATAGNDEEEEFDDEEEDVVTKKRKTSKKTIDDDDDDE